MASAFLLELTLAFRYICRNLPTMIFVGVENCLHWWFLDSCWSWTIGFGTNEPHHAKRRLSPGRPISRKRVSKFWCARPRNARSQRCIASFLIANLRIQPRCPAYHWKAGLKGWVSVFIWSKSDKQSKSYVRLNLVCLRRSCSRTHAKF